MPDVIEAVFPRYGDLPAVDRLAGRRGHRLRVDGVVAVTAQEERLPVQQQARPIDRDPPKTKTRRDGIDLCAAIGERQPGRVQVRRVGRPEQCARDRNLNRAQRRFPRGLRSANGVSVLVADLHGQRGARRRRALDRCGHAASRWVDAGLDEQTFQVRGAAGLDAHMSPDAAPVRVHVVDDVPGADHRVDIPTLFGIDTDGDHGLRARCGMVGNIELEGREATDVLSQEHAVHPHGRVTMHAAEAQEHPAPRPCGGHVDLALVPAFANEMVAQFVGLAAESLGFPRAWHLDRVREGRRTSEPLLGLAGVPRVHPERPCAVQVKRRALFAPRGTGEKTTQDQARKSSKNP